MKPFKLKKKRQRYPHKITFVDGIKFHSKDEARRYKELIILEKTEEIQNLILQPRFLIQEPYVYRGAKVRKAEYVADFMYNNLKGEVIVEDVKSDHTAKDELYRLKKKLMLFRNMGVIFKEVIY
jgi:hypothetical protein